MLGMLGEMFELCRRAALEFIVLLIRDVDWSGDIS